MKDILNYKGNNITFELGNGDVMVNLTEMAKSFPDKNLSQIVKSKEIKEYVSKLSAIKNYIPTDLLLVRNGGDDFGTWAHQRIAIRVAQKLSTEFAILVDEKIEELLTKGHTSITKPMTPAEMFLHNAQLMVEHEHRLSYIETKMIEIEAKSTTRPEYYTIAGYGIIRGINVGLSLAASLGRKASSICKLNGYSIDKVHDPRFGLVGSYPKGVLDTIFSESFN